MLIFPKRSAHEIYHGISAEHCIVVMRQHSLLSFMFKISNLKLLNSAILISLLRRDYSLTFELISMLVEVKICNRF